MNPYCREISWDDCHRRFAKKIPIIEIQSSGPIHVAQDSKLKSVFFVQGSRKDQRIISRCHKPVVLFHQWFPFARL